MAADDGTLYLTYATNLYDSPQLYLHRSTDGGADLERGRIDSAARPIAKIGALDFEGHELLLLGDSLARLSCRQQPGAGRGPPPTRRLSMPPGTTGAGKRFQLLRPPGQTWRHRLQPQHRRRGHLERARCGSTTIRRPTGWTSSARLIAVGRRRADRRDLVRPARRSRTATCTTSITASPPMGAPTWSANERVSDVPSNPMACAFSKGNGYLATTAALAYGPDYALPGWIDTPRRGTPRTSIPTGRLSPPVPTPTATPRRGSHPHAHAGSAHGDADPVPAAFRRCAARRLFCRPGALAGLPGHRRRLCATAPFAPVQPDHARPADQDGRPGLRLAAADPGRADLRGRAGGPAILSLCRDRRRPRGHRRVSCGGRANPAPGATSARRRT